MFTDCQPRINDVPASNEWRSWGSAWVSDGDALKLVGVATFFDAFNQPFIFHRVYICVTQVTAGEDAGTAALLCRNVADAAAGNQ